jgi:hypothetical protein
VCNAWKQGLPSLLILRCLCALYSRLLCNCVSRPQGARTGSDAWTPSYEIAGGSSTMGSTAVVAERRVPSAGELSLIQDLRDQLKRAE